VQQSRDLKPALAIARLPRRRSASRNEYSFFCADFADGAILFAYGNIALRKISVEWMQDSGASVSAVIAGFDTEVGCSRLQHA
jgi:hypothetical protein